MMMSDIPLDLVVSVILHLWFQSLEIRNFSLFLATRLLFPFWFWLLISREMEEAVGGRRGWARGAHRPQEARVESL